MGFAGIKPYSLALCTMLLVRIDVSSFEERESIIVYFSVVNRKARAYKDLLEKKAVLLQGE